MAAIIKRNNTYNVVYTYTEEDGSRKQKWESFRTQAEAVKRRKEIEYKMSTKEFVVPKCETLEELLNEYVDLYGREKWSMSYYSTCTSRIRLYILPHLGKMKIDKITTHTIERYYQQLLTEKADGGNHRKEKDVTPALVIEIHKILRGCFNQAVKWQMLEKNPAQYAVLPKNNPGERQIWDADTLMTAMQVCSDDRLKLCINLSFACSMRLGEILGLTWDCVDISPEAISEGRAYVYINKELERVYKKAMDNVSQNGVITVFPSASKRNATVLVLKTPKTASSVRKVFLPKTVADMLNQWREQQNAVKELLGDEYQDYNLVVASAAGTPTEHAKIRSGLQKLIRENNLPPVVFHSLRHSSITYKLRMNGGDIKSVQGDSGHSQVKMVTDVYSHILDDNRRVNAQLLEQNFYNNTGKDQKKTQKKEESAGIKLPEGMDPETLEKILQNPDVASLLVNLAKRMGK